MQKISVDLVRLAVSSAAICATVGTAEFRSLHHGGRSSSRELASRRHSRESHFCWRAGGVLDNRGAGRRFCDARGAKRPRASRILLERRADDAPPQRTAGPTGDGALTVCSAHNGRFGTSIARSVGRACDGSRRAAGSFTLGIFRRCRRSNDPATVSKRSGTAQFQWPSRFVTNTRRAQSWTRTELPAQPGSHRRRKGSGRQGRRRRQVAERRQDREGRRQDSERRRRRQRRREGRAEEAVRPAASAGANPISQEAGS